ncbi:MAG: TonB-dependent receptor [Cyanobacteria bacterium P01_C01_bin.89]
MVRISQQYLIGRLINQGLYGAGLVLLLAAQPSQAQDSQTRNSQSLDAPAVSHTSNIAGAESSHSNDRSAAIAIAPEEPESLKDVLSRQSFEARDLDSNSSATPNPAGFEIADTEAAESDETEIEVSDPNPEAAEDENDGGALRITVTAERKPEDQQDVPIGITTFTEQQIEDASIDSLNSTADRTPNFSFFSSGSRTSPFYSLRGVSNFNAFVRDGVGIFVDDVPYDFAGFIDQDLVDIERIEVLRGPQNILYGRSAAGGVVNVISRRPSNDFEVRAATSYASFDNSETQISLSGPIVEDRLLFRLAGSYSTREGYVENTFLNDDIDGGDAFTGRGQLLWTPTDQWEVTLNVSFGDYQEGAEPLVPVRPGDPFEAELDFNGFNNLFTNSQALKVAYKGSRVNVTSITTRRYSRNRAALDQDGTLADFLINDPEFIGRTFTQEIRLQSPDDGDRLQWIAGGYFERSNFENNRDFILGSFLPPEGQGTERSDGEIDSRSLAVFGQVSYEVTDDLTLTAGLRYENTRVSVDYTQTFIPPDGSSSLVLEGFNDATISGSELLPRFVVDYRISPEVMVYGSITRGYRPPGGNFEPQTEDVAVFDGERSWNYEIGLKSSWFDDRLIVNLAGFYNKTSDFQFPNIEAGEVTISNADVRTIGAELEILARPLPGLELSASLGLLSAEFENGVASSTGESLKGSSTPFAPDLTYNVAAQYRSKGGFFGRIEMIGFGTTFFDDINTVPQDPFALVNAQLGYEFDDYGIYLFANNLFDKEYLTQAFDFNGIIAVGGAPQVFGIRLRAKF